MREICVLFVVVLLLLVGCSGSQVQVEKQTSTSIIVTAAGIIAWDVLPNPPKDLPIEIWEVGVGYVTTYYAPDDWQGYIETGITLPTEYGDYNFIAKPPAGYSINGSDTILKENVSDNSILSVSFEVEMD